MAEVTAICIAAAAGEPMRCQESVIALAGAGLEGDRYLSGIGFYSAVPTDPGARELTLIEEEALLAISTDTGIDLGMGRHRRNLTTRGIHLDPLLGKRFRIGEVVAEGVRACPPCKHLDEVIGESVMPALVRLGGLRARIITGGTIRVGDQIEELA